jgi:hypothetical protein
MRQLDKAVGIVALAVILLLAGPSGQLSADEKPAAKPKLAWTLEEAKAQLTLNPRDAYLQYVVLQLARREKQFDPNADLVDQIVNGGEGWAGNRRHQVDLFSLFTGAHAVQESLQLDAMRGESRRRGGPAAIRPVAPGQDADKAEQERRAAEEKRRKESIDIGTLTGPTIKSHPWKKLLVGKKPEVSGLSRYVPEDYYFAEFRSLNKLIEAMEVSDLWGTHLFSQAVREARTQNVGEHLKTQLVVETAPLLRPFYDLVVEEVAIAGSDLFVREGSDMTVLFKLKQPEVFQARMDEFLANAAKAHPDAKRTTGEYQGIAYVQLATPDRAVNVFSAYPAADLHVRSNSKVAFRRILDAFKGKGADGKPVRRLGESDEFAYLRTLLPRGKDEDGFVYLSDPFIRRLMGPAVKLTEQRRMLCYNHLRMIGHASLLYRTEFGKPPASLVDLANTQCAPGVFGQRQLACPDGGQYTLSKDGMTGVCSHHGHAHQLTPCCEVLVDKVNGVEADDYKAFLEDYNQYWGQYFDPIAIRIQITPRRYRLETVVLPLIGNSIYTGLAATLGGQPEPLDALPVPKGNIFSVAVRVNKDELLKHLDEMAKKGGEEEVQRTLARELGIPDKDAARLNVRDLREVLTKGLGNQIGLHAYDAMPTFDLNLPSFLGELLGSFRGLQRGNGVEVAAIGFLISSLTSPTYLSLPVQDAKVVDHFLEGLDPLFAALARQRERRDRFGFAQDFYFLKNDRSVVVRGNSVGFGPVKFRFFSARIGNGFYVASKLFILEDLAALEAAKKKDPAKVDRGPVAHAMVRVRAENWDKVLPDYRLGWAENNRQACLDNLGPLSSIGRSFTASGLGKRDAADRSAAELGTEVHRLADRLHAVHFFCPEGGRYELSPDGKAITCSLHGSALAPRQPSAPAEKGVAGKLLRQFGGMTATLTFLEDGLHAVVTIDRR